MPSTASAPTLQTTFPGNESMTSWSNRFSPETIAALKQAFKIIFRAEIPLKDALARAEAELPPLPEVKHLIAFVRESKRGVLR